MDAHPRAVTIPPLGLPGALAAPAPGRGVVAFAHGSGSGRLSPRNTFVAAQLRRAGLGTLLFDLLRPEEAHDRAKVFDIGLLAGRLVQATDWLRSPQALGGAAAPVGYFGASTGAAAALIAAAERPEISAAVVSRGGRPDLAGEALLLVRAPTLLIVGGADLGVIELNEEALDRLRGPKALEIVPGATHLFPEPGAMEAVIAQAGRWFERYLQAPGSARAAS